MANHTRIYVPPSHTKNIFGNMKRVGQGFLGRVTPLFLTMLLQAQQEVDEGTKIPTDTQQTSTIIQPTISQPQRKQMPRKSRRKDTELPQTSIPTEVVADEAVYEEMYDSVERAATTATGLDAEHDRGSGPRRQETMGNAAAQTRVLDLEITKTAQANDIANLKERVKRLERKKKSRSHGLKRLYKVIKDITTVDIEETVSTTTPITTDVTPDELTLAQALVEIKKSKPKDASIETTIVTIPTYDGTRPKTRGVVMQEPSETLTTTTVPISLKFHEKGKGIMVEEPLKMKKNDQISFDEQEARRLQAEINEEERLAREKAQKEKEENDVLINTWDDIQAKIDADAQLAQRLQQEE
nr:hypothetical protein [Tanacetum cinerariifolium]